MKSLEKLRLFYPVSDYTPNKVFKAMMNDPKIGKWLFGCAEVALNSKLATMPISRGMPNILL